MPPKTPIKFTAAKILFLTALFLVAIFVQAQVVPEALSLVASPLSPSPQESITFQAATPTFDFNTAFFSWSVNGNPRADLSGQGKNRITLQAGGLGSTMRVEVKVSRPGANTASASLTAHVSDLSLSWFAETYVPKWYKGKALPTQKSTVAIIALPEIIIDGKTIPPSNLIYRWSLDDQDDALVGIGQNKFRIQASNFPQTSSRVRAVVEDTNKRVRKEADLFIVPVEPRAVIYQPSPLGGIDPRASASFIVKPKTGLFDFILEPFFFPVKSKSSLSYGWSVGGKEISGNPDNPFLITIDTAGQNPGTIPISATVQSSDSSFPSAAGNSLLLLQ